MPFCMAQCGLLLGLFVLLVCGCLTLQSSLMLVKSAKAKHKKTYEYLAQACFGAVGKFAIEFAQIGLMLGTCIAFYIVISSLLVEVFGDLLWVLKFIIILSSFLNNDFIFIVSLLLNFKI